VHSLSRAATSNLDGLDVRRREVDITKASQLTGAFEGVKYCFHLAAKFGFWPRDASSFYSERPRQSERRSRCHRRWRRAHRVHVNGRDARPVETKRGDLRMKTTSPKSRTSTGTTSRRSMSPNTKCSASPRRVPGRARVADDAARSLRSSSDAVGKVVLDYLNGRCRLRRHRHERRARR